MGSVILNMSPLFSLIALLLAAAILLSAAVFFVGAILRNKRILLITPALALPPLILISSWWILASSAPEPITAFSRVFGRENIHCSTEIKTSKPTLMDGYFMSFKISREDFASKIRPQLEEQVWIPDPQSDNILGNQILPSFWPPEVQSQNRFFYGNVDGYRLKLVYLPAYETAYASVSFPSW
jgi:hypothetical protein